MRTPYYQKRRKAASMPELLHLDTTDVLVVGAGLAGISAAVSAAEAGAKVMLASAGPIFSGSSFSSATWGLGMVAPESAADEEDLEETILSVGAGAADPTLVRSFVSGIYPAMQWLEDHDVKLKAPDRPEEREYIPCFDHKTRLWRGLGRAEFRDAMAPRLQDLDVHLIEHASLARLKKADDGSIQGAIFFDGASSSFIDVPARSTILATGGTAGLFGRHIGAAKDTGCAHALAKDAGAHLVNLEFIQLMPAILTDRGPVVFNEKTFRYLVLEDGEASSISRDLFELRSSHGPATARLGDAAIDLAIAEAGEKGAPAHYENLPDPLPELDRTYFSWLEGRLGHPLDQSFRIALFAHASNGGIRIDGSGWTGVPGLFAAGEATGGMHGADRLGGLSSANCIVFGIRAGEAAADAAESVSAPLEGMAGLPNICSPLAAKALPAIRLALDSACLAPRCERDLVAAQSSLHLIDEAIERTSLPTQDAKAIFQTLEAKAALATAQEMIEAMRRRRESAGSHIRSDAD
jgi:succinate dehydrogenase/fumarate reductase flavoprotein subunit